jgi:hypothetical protein
LGRTSLVQSRCSCYPLFVEFAVGVTNKRERERAPKSLWCVRLLLCAGELRSFESPYLEGFQGLPFIDQERSLRVHGKRMKEEEKREKAEEEALAVMPLSSCRRRPIGLIIEDRGRPPCHHSTVVVAVVACYSPSHGIVHRPATRRGSRHNVHHL